MIVRGNATQFSDSAYREELGYWIGQGVFGTPWLLAKIGQLAVTYMNIGRGQAKKDSEVLMRTGDVLVVTKTLKIGTGVK